ncbi:MAG: hypothetical protein IJS96_07890, partial [Schwartzia sp.]|nr:hypothetical protein [Schwartzia sp. (in: firmicutes)]
MRKINFYKSRGQLYAKVPATSYRENGKVKKRNDGIYLGRVIDESKNVFYSSDRGIFTYDVASNTFGIADETYVTNIPDDQRKRPKVCLDFGDSYFVYELIRACGYDLVINSLPYRNKDTLNAMIQYYILRDKANDHAGIDTDFVLMDAGYFTDDNIDALYNAGIEFITRLPERNRNLYSAILSEG